MMRFIMFNKVKNSIVFRIGALMTAMTIMALLSMFSSFVISEMASSDAAAINQSGSLRKSSYELLSYAYLANDSEEAYSHRINQFENTLSSSVVLNNVNKLEVGDKIFDLYQSIKDDWFYKIKPLLLKTILQNTVIDSVQSEKNNALTEISLFVENINELVVLYQTDAEDKIEMLRIIQIISLFGTLILVFVAMNSVSNHIEKPLGQLTEMAKRVSSGQLNERVELDNKDELGVLADSFNSMSEALVEMYEKLEDKVEDKTRQLKESNDILQFLIETARRISEGLGGETDFQPILDRVASLSGIQDMDLCLSTDKSASPYIHMLVEEDKTLRNKCDSHHCNECVGEGCFVSSGNGGYSVKFPLVQDDLNYGVLVARVPYEKGIQQWQHDLIQSVADQISMALSLDRRSSQDRRMSLLNERTIIARELHDSLAQSLSYLKIQVMRLQKGYEKGIDEKMFQELIGELREGLGGAYRQLRELLSTFRLQIDGTGLKGAMISAFDQLNTRSDMQVNLNYQIDSVLLSPNEEIHLLQISKEAVQNAIYHSKGTRVDIDVLVQEGDVLLTIKDDGVGIKDDPGKLNHYGLAIMNERGRNLAGDICISRREEGGTQVEIQFTPDSRSANTPTFHQA
jgi:two-component system nitrate/nitrite sensor histidine kinase NarX